MIVVSSFFSGPRRRLCGSALRFLGSAEFPTHPIYLELVIRPQAQDTVYTERFAGGWPINAPHRVLRSCAGTAEASGGEIVGGQLQSTGQRRPLRRFQRTLGQPPTCPAMWRRG